MLVRWSERYKFKAIVLYSHVATVKPSHNPRSIKLETTDFNMFLPVKHELYADVLAFRNLALTLLHGAIQNVWGRIDVELLSYSITNSGVYSFPVQPLAESIIPASKFLRDEPVSITIASVRPVNGLTSLSAFLGRLVLRGLKM